MIEIIFILIGVLLISLALFIAKNLRDKEGNPILRIWHIIIGIIMMLIPILGAAVGMSALICIFVNMDTEDYKWKDNSKFIEFLNRKIG